MLAQVIENWTEIAQVTSYSPTGSQAVSSFVLKNRSKNGLAPQLKAAAKCHCLAQLLCIGLWESIDQVVDLYCKKYRGIFSVLNTVQTLALEKCVTLKFSPTKNINFLLQMFLVPEMKKGGKITNPKKFLEAIFSNLKLIQRNCSLGCKLERSAKNKIIFLLCKIPRLSYHIRPKGFFYKGLFRPLYGFCFFGYLFDNPNR